MFIPLKRTFSSNCNIFIFLLTVWGFIKIFLCMDLFNLFCKPHTLNLFESFVWHLILVIEYSQPHSVRTTYVLGGNYPWEFWALKWSFFPLEKIFICFFQIPSRTRNLHHLYCKFMTHFNVLTVQYEFLASKSPWDQSELLLHKVNSML